MALTCLLEHASPAHQKSSGGWTGWHKCTAVEPTGHKHTLSRAVRSGAARSHALFVEAGEKCVRLGAVYPGQTRPKRDLVPHGVGFDRPEAIERVGGSAA